VPSFLLALFRFFFFHFFLKNFYNASHLYPGLLKGLLDVGELRIFDL
jgi:hypothetical protein